MASLAPHALAISGMQDMATHAAPGASSTETDAEKKRRKERERKRAYRARKKAELEGTVDAQG